MRVVHQVCCGLDVHKRTVVACLLIAAQGQSTKQLRTFGTTTRDLRQLTCVVKPLNGNSVVNHKQKGSAGTLPYSDGRAQQKTAADCSAAV